MISEDKLLPVAIVARVSTLLIFAMAIAVTTAGCGASVEVTKNASGPANSASNRASNTATGATDVKQNAADLAEDDAKDARADAATSGKEIKPVDGFKLKSIEPLEGTVIGGILNDYATSLPDPEYPAEAKAAAKASGKIPVEVVVNEKGVVSAVSVVEGPQPLRAAAAAAAREAKFEPFLKDGKPVKVVGVINYEFAN